jgi:hypothetical protein
LDKQNYIIVDTKIECNLKLVECFCSCFPNCNKNCPNYGKNEDEPKRKIILIIEDDNYKRVQVECEIASIVWRDLN